jgi:cystathionine beta-lyase/cystathionine gamma-synthase
MKYAGDPKYIEAFLIHGKDVTPRWDYSHHVIPPITSTVTYRLENVERGAKGFSQYANLDELPEEPIYIYERLDDPTTGMLEDRLATAEKTETTVTFSTGMAAIAACVGILIRDKRHIVANDSLYGCTYSLFQNWMPRQGVDVDFVNMVKDAGWHKMINDNTKLIYFETPINPNMEIIDIAEVRQIVDEVNKKRDEIDKIRIVVDNTFASPYCQRPIKLGADFVVGSLTKHIGGFNTGMGGYVACSKKYHNPLLMFRKDYGAVLHSKTAWQFLVYGLPTLAVRMRQQTETTGKLVEFLAGRSEVKEVHYPGLETFPHHGLAKKQMRSYDGSFAPGSLLYFVLDGPPEEARKKGAKLINWLAENSLCYTLAVSLGCIKTLIEHPSSMTQAAIPLEEQIEAGIDPGGIRIAVGLEEPAMLIEDLEKAFGQV